MKTPDQIVAEIEARVRPTIGPTFRMAHDGPVETIEGRISQADFDTLVQIFRRVQAEERERCAMLHETVNPASDEERLNRVPGAGAMGAVIEYRDLIRG